MNGNTDPIGRIDAALAQGGGPMPPEPFPPGPLPHPPVPGPIPDWPPYPQPWPPPDWWRCLRRQGVSGRYEGGVQGVRLGTVLDLRVDIDPRYSTESPVMNKVSADVYSQRWTPAPRPWPPGVPGQLRPIRTYVESWIVDTPVVTWSRCRVEITGQVRYWMGVHPATTVDIVIGWSRGSIGPAQVTLTPAGSTSSTYTCSFRSDCFRTVSLETDYCRSVNRAPQLPTYDTHWHSTRPADTPQRVLTIEEAYREAGVCVTISPDHTEIDDSAAGFATWSPAELHDAMEVAFSQYPNPWPRWNLWGLLAGSYDNAGVGGIMFDAGAGYGGAGEAPDRQGFAVFRNHTWFTNLVEGTPTNQDQAWAMRHFLYTWVHEAGHAYNLLHSWNKGRPDSLSWMNYDWKYDARNGTDSFWSNFRFRFDDEELIHIRHGDRATVIMGGDPWASGGHLDAPTGSLTQTSPNSDVELLVRSRGYFDFMEPVDVELRLRNRSTEPIVVDARMDPEAGNTVVYVKHPNGRVTIYHPVMCQYGTPEMVTLEPLAPDGSNEGRDRYSARVPVTFGSRGFLLDAPGEYLVRAVYTGAGLLLTSNTARIRVGRPTDRDEDRFAYDYFTPQVGLSLVVHGSQSPFLAAGMDQLREAAERFGERRLGAKAAATVAHSVGNDFYRRVERQMVKTHDADPGEALRLTEPAMAYYRDQGSRSENLDYHALVQMRAQLHAKADDVSAAREELQTLTTDLAARGVNPPVIADIHAFSQRL